MFFDRAGWGSMRTGFQVARVPMLVGVRIMPIALVCGVNAMGAALALFRLLWRHGGLARTTSLLARLSVQ